MNLFWPDWKDFSNYIVRGASYFECFNGFKISNNTVYMYRSSGGSSIRHLMKLKKEGGAASLLGLSFCCTDNFVIYVLPAVKQFFNVKVIMLKAGI